jgi:hypothetical protein
MVMNVRVAWKMSFFIDISRNISFPRNLIGKIPFPDLYFLKI